MPRRRASATSIGHAPLCTWASSSASCRRSMSAPDRAELAHAQLLYGTGARAGDLEAHAARHDAVARLRYAAEPFEDEASERLVLPLGEIPAKTLVHFEDWCACTHEEDTGSHLSIELSWRIIFILDLADNLLHEILDRHQSD